MRTALACLAAACLTAGLVVPVDAHDFWVEASRYRPRVGGLVALRLLVGQDMLGDPMPRDESAIGRFVVSRGALVEPVPGREGADPAGIVRVGEPGLMVVGYQSLPRPIELPPGKFEQYLGEEGLDEITSILAVSKSRDRVARELFARCAKALVQSGPAAAGEGDRRLGLTLELVAERSPYEIGAERDLSFTLTYEGRPKSGALVVAMSQRDPSKKLTARSDRVGRVSFAFPTGGVWLVKAVHMMPAPAGSQADWQSFWASLTFDLPDAARVSTASSR